MFRNILVAVDGSVASNRGLKVALAFAKDQGAALHVVHILDESTLAQHFEGEIYLPPDYVDTAIAGLRESGSKVLERAEALAKKQGQPIRTSLVASRGRDVAQSIVHEARRVRAQLIVLGTHGRRGLRRVLLGSDAEAVLREATVPVLLVRAEPHLAPYIAPARAQGAPSRVSDVAIVRAGPPYP